MPNKERKIRRPNDPFTTVRYVTENGRPKMKTSIDLFDPEEASANPIKDDAYYQQIANELKMLESISDLQKKKHAKGHFIQK